MGASAAAVTKSNTCRSLEEHLETQRHTKTHTHVHSGIHHTSIISAMQ